MQLDIVKVERFTQRVLFFGDRNWVEAMPIIERLRREKDLFGGRLVVITGGCRGADALATFHAKAMNIVVEEYPADWSLGVRAGPVRNQQMLETRIDFGHGFHESIDNSAGTFDMCCRLLKAQVPFNLYPPQVVRRAWR